MTFNLQVSDMALCVRQCWHQCAMSIGTARSRVMNKPKDKSGSDLDNSAIPVLMGDPLEHLNQRSVLEQLA